VINIGPDACNVIISRRKEREEIEAYSPSSNYRIPAHASASFKKRKPASTLPQGKPHTQHYGETSLGGDKINKTLLRKCFMDPKSSHTIFESNSLRKALGAPLVKDTLPKNLVNYHTDYYYPRIFFIQSCKPSLTFTSKG
jgi:hypothetical protein